MNSTIKFSGVSAISARLKEARASTGLSTRAVAEFIRKRIPGQNISHASIANYESGKSDPPATVVSVLATVYERPLAWFFDKSVPLTGIQYRQLSSRVGIRERHRFETQAQHLLEAYIKLEYRLRKPLTPKRKLSIKPGETPEALARRVRNLYSLEDDQPVNSVIEILEDFGIRTIEMPTQIRVDAMAARLGGHPVVILNPSVSNDRIRISALHEWKHVFGGDCDSEIGHDRKREDDAFEFACHLLIPRSELAKAFENRSAVELLAFKEKFGISMAAMVYRAEKLGIIDARTTRQIWIQFSRKGWRAKEPGFVRADRAIRFETLLDGALSSKQLNWEEIVSVTGMQAAELQNRIKLAMGIPDEEKGGPALKIRV
jgi:Zn-dependent peptidase ImmA (M78 family)